ncbi:MAG TPA: DUF4870 domain-containing protein [Thermoflexia bacterium]|nr:DUF4870 domain-containing protein [Thermoflexia bacterium]
MEWENLSTEATQDERIMAALAHASVILPFWGLIGAIVIWATQREKSRFVGFQALQVMAYQLALILVGLLGFGCYLCSFFGTFMLMPLGMFAAEGASDAEGIMGMLAAMLTTFFPFCVMGIFILVGIAFVGYGLYGAARVLQGHDFRYALIGCRLEQYMNREKPAV